MGACHSVKFILKSLVASSIMGLAVWWFNPVSVIDIILGALMGAVIYFVILLALRSITRNELEFFLDFLPGSRIKRWFLSTSSIKLIFPQR